MFSFLTSKKSNSLCLSFSSVNSKSFVNIEKATRSYPKKCETITILSGMHQCFGMKASSLSHGSVRQWCSVLFWLPVTRSYLVSLGLLDNSTCSRWSTILFRLRLNFRSAIRILSLVWEHQNLLKLFLLNLSYPWNANILWFGNLFHH